MKMFYKIIMFLMLMLFCVGSVCAADPDNTTSTNLTDNQNVINIVTQALEKKILKLKLYKIMILNNLMKSSS